MIVKCKICDKELKQITSTHLKTHNMKVEDYIEQYGKESLVSAEYREHRSRQNSGEKNPNYSHRWSKEQKDSLSKKKKGSTPWNKGKKVTDETVLANIRQGTSNREERYAKGEISRAEPHERTNEIKQKISASVKAYAESNPGEMKERAQKSLKTKTERGYDFAVFRGKKHSLDALEKISKNSSIHAKHKEEDSFWRKVDTAKRAGIELVEITKCKSYKRAHMYCTTCSYVFTLSAAMLVDRTFNLELCPICNPRNITRSIAEKEIFEFVLKICPDARYSDRQLISPKEIDILIPSLKIGIEYNGGYWHSERYKTPKCSVSKLDAVNDQGYRLITIYDDEYINTPDIVLSRLSAILGKSSNTVFARKTQVQEITPKVANKFLNENHIQGSGQSKIRLGLYYGETLVSVMTFSKSNLSRKILGWEINRFCSLLDYNIVGGASKLFKYFVRNYNPVSVISYADRRWSDGDLYCQLGFTFSHNSPPNYWYIQPPAVKRIHRFTLRKNKADDQDLSEHQNRLKQGYLRLWDCGSSKWIWTQPKPS